MVRHTYTQTCPHMGIHFRKFCKGQSLRPPNIYTNSVLPDQSTGWPTRVVGNAHSCLLITLSVSLECVPNYWVHVKLYCKRLWGSCKMKARADNGDGVKLTTGVLLLPEIRSSQRSSPETNEGRNYVTVPSLSLCLFWRSCSCSASKRAIRKSMLCIGRARPQHVQVILWGL